jgi:predicted PurR-regulated permease PerM
MSPAFSLQLLGRILVVAILVVLAIFILRHMLPALGWAVVLAIATWPLRRWQAGNAKASTVQAILLTIAVGLVILGPLVIISIQGSHEVGVIAHWVQEAREKGLATPDWLSRLPVAGGYAASWWHDHLGNPEGTQQLLGRVQSMQPLRWTRHVGSELFSRLVILGFTLLTLLFIYRDGPLIIEQSRNVADRVLGASARPYAVEAIAAVRATVNGLVLVGLGEGALLFVAYLVVGLPHPLMFGFATGILATIPFGAPLVYSVACLILLADSRIAAAVAIFLIGSVVVFIADHFVRPALIGMSTRLPFIWILLGIFGGLETFGLLGLFLGPAILAVVLAIWREGARPVPQAEPFALGH